MQKSGQPGQLDQFDGLEGKAVGAERAISPRGQRKDDDVISVDSDGWDCNGKGATFNFPVMAHFDTHLEGEDQVQGDPNASGGQGEKQTPVGTMTPPPQFTEGHTDVNHIRSPGERRIEDRLAQSWPPRTPGPSVTLDELPMGEIGPAFTLDPGTGDKPAIPSAPFAKGHVGSLLGRAPIAPKPMKNLAEGAVQTEPENVQNVSITNATTVSNPGAVFCTVMLNGVQCIQCNVPVAEDSASQVEATISKEVSLYGEANGLFLQLMFYSPNFPAKPDFHIHGTLELLDKDDQIITTIYLGLLEDNKQVEKKQHTVAGVPVKAIVILSSIPPVRVGPNEMQLVEEICDVLRNTRINPGRGSLPSVLVQHRAKESPLYDKVVVKYFQNSWHTFMKAHDDVFTLFHYSQKEIGDRRLGPFAKFNEARIVLREHEKGDWKAADEMAALRHAQAEEGLKSFLVRLLEQRDYDQRELLEVLHGNTHFNHFLSPTFSILMRTLCRHKGTFITSSDSDQPTRIGLARPDQSSIEHRANDSHLASKGAGSVNANNTPILSYGAPQQPQAQNNVINGVSGRSPLLQFSMVPQQQGTGRLKTEEDTVGNLMNDLGIPNSSGGSFDKVPQGQPGQGRSRSWSKGSQGQDPLNGVIGSGAEKQLLNTTNGMDAMLVASAVPIQTTVPATQNIQQQLLFDHQTRGLLQLQQPQQSQQLVQLGGLGNQVQLLDGQNATVVVLKGSQGVVPQQQQVLQPQYPNQQVLLVNQPAATDGNWVVAQAGQPGSSDQLYQQSLQSTPPSAPLGSAQTTPTDQALQSSFYPQYLLSATAY